MRTLTIAEAAQRACFETEALLHLDALYSFALKLSRVRDDAEDLVSETRFTRCRMNTARPWC